MTTALTHPAAPRMARFGCGLHPGQCAEVRRGRTVTPEIRPYIAIAQGGRWETSDPRELERMAAIYHDLAAELRTALARFDGAADDQPSLFDGEVA